MSVLIVPVNTNDARVFVTVFARAVPITVPPGGELAELSNIFSLVRTMPSVHWQQLMTTVCVLAEEHEYPAVRRCMIDALFANEKIMLSVDAIRANAAKVQALKEQHARVTTKIADEERRKWS